MTLRPLTPDERDQVGVPGGLVVEDASGRAAEAGIQQGDVVLSVDGTPVQSVEQLRKPRARARQAGRAADSARRQPHLRPRRTGLILRRLPLRHDRRCAPASVRPAAFATAVAARARIGYKDADEATSRRIALAALLISPVAPDDDRADQAACRARDRRRVSPIRRRCARRCSARRRKTSRRCPPKVPLIEMDLALPWAQPVPHIFWFDRRLRVWFSAQKKPAPLAIVIAGTGERRQYVEALDAACRALRRRATTC